MHAYLCMDVWVNASPRSPSSAAPCDNGLELLVCCCCRAIFSPDGVSQGGPGWSWEDGGEESRDKVIELLTDVWHSQTQMVNNYCFLTGAGAGAWHAMTVP